MISPLSTSRDTEYSTRPGTSSYKGGIDVRTAYKGGIDYRQLTEQSYTPILIANCSTRARSRASDSPPLWRFAPVAAKHHRCRRLVGPSSGAPLAQRQPRTPHGHRCPLPPSKCTDTELPSRTRSGTAGLRRYLCSERASGRPPCWRGASLCPPRTRASSSPRQQARDAGGRAGWPRGPLWGGASTRRTLAAVEETHRRSTPRGCEHQHRDVRGVSPIAQCRAQGGSAPFLPRLSPQRLDLLRCQPRKAAPGESVPCGQSRRQSRLLSVEGRSPRRSAAVCSPPAREQRQSLVAPSQPRALQRRPPRRERGDSTHSTDPLFRPLTRLDPRERETERRQAVGRRQSLAHEGRIVTAHTAPLRALDASAGSSTPSAWGGRVQGG
eukprot:scaffold117001_cov36-Tisochrysis_lutea.AAC.1